MSCSWGECLASPCVWAIARLQRQCGHLGAHVEVVICSACGTLAQSGLRMELDVWIHPLPGWLLSSWPSMCLVLHFVFAAVSVSRPGSSPSWVLCRTLPCS